MIRFELFLNRPEFRQWRSHFSLAIKQRTDPKRHGDLNAWLGYLTELPKVVPSRIQLQSNTITIGDPNDLTPRQADELRHAFMALSPWRKGPYRLFDCLIDTEWRSDWKWQRLIPHISNLSGRRTLDVGCGTGYHGWRMLGEDAAYVLGIDPSMRFLVQFNAIQHYINDARFDFLPLGIEDMPADLAYFDSVFSMGVMYHRRNPINHLIELKQLMRPNGELILETLIIDEADNGLFRPQGRYAQMRNVWSIMTIDRIVQLLKQAGFSKIRCVNQNVTSLDEQRRTPWMQYHSLENFLDPRDMTKTIEGHPAPKRGIFVAQKAS